jgi:ubiquinone/menaquinone biosynthesis C-methylase UbiE
MVAQREVLERRSTAHDERIRSIRQRVVGMYSRVPWPGTRRTDEEMGWRLKSSGVTPDDFKGKRVIEVGCGTGDYALWYATHGAGHVTGVDLSDGSLAAAHQKKKTHGIENITFLKQDVLKMAFADDSFDYSYSVGVLHHTGDPLRGFREMVRITKPGGVVIVSLYNQYSRFLLNLRQKICAKLGGNDLEARCRWKERLFPFCTRKLNKRYHNLNYKEVLYDCYACPHETLHTGHEILKWFDSTGIVYTGSFAPLRLQDYPYIFSLPEYREFRKTFDGFPVMRMAGDALARLMGCRHRAGVKEFRRPSRLNTILCQLLWIPFGLRISCFTLAGRKRQ